MITAVLSTWLLLAAIGAVAFCLIARGRRLATVPPNWRAVCERVRRRIQEIDADLEIAEWRPDPDGQGSLIVVRDGTRTPVPLKELRDAPPALFEQRLRDVLLACVPGLFKPAAFERIGARLPRQSSRRVESAESPPLPSELRRMRPRTP
jgi:hypothetical protein